MSNVVYEWNSICDHSARKVAEESVSRDCMTGFAEDLIEHEEENEDESRLNEIKTSLSSQTSSLEGLIRDVASFQDPLSKLNRYLSGGTLAGSFGEWSELSSFSIKEKQFPERVPDIYNEDLIQDGLVAFGGFAPEFASVVIDKYGNEIWNSGEPGSFDFMINHINKFGNIYGQSFYNYPYNTGTKINYDIDFLWSTQGDLNDRVVTIYSGIKEILEKHKVDIVVIERVFMRPDRPNPDAAIKLGHARGAVISAAGGQDLPIVDYSPNQIKKTLVGNGHASKEQVSFMVQKLLKLNQAPQADAADALAGAICHAYHSL